MTTRWIAIVNPAAGHGKCRRQAEAELAALRTAGADLDVRNTEAPGHASRLAREAFEAGARDFLAVGGDGTCFEIVNGLAGSANPGARPRVATLPLGTGNSFLRDYGIVDAAGAARALLADARRTVDLVRCEHAAGTLHYLNIAGLGFAARAGAMTNRRFKSFGARGYVLAVIGCVARMRYPSFPVRLDGGKPDQRPCSMLSFCNSRYTGGTMMMAPAADAADGYLDVIRIGPMGRIRLLRSFPRIFKGTHVELPEVECSKARRVDFEGGATVDVMIDGEVLALALRSLEVAPGAIDVVA
ncbi:MAG: YegS/Rv2252/BmrU family lipid kinase [Deltaproteobacteria bacterium]|nr:YegS/Rv2252/BmrU family lipid kinase [Deltaproteobacteria bacterium]